MLEFIVYSADTHCPLCALHTQKQCSEFVGLSAQTFKKYLADPKHVYYVHGERVTIRKVNIPGNTRLSNINRYFCQKSEEKQ